MCALMQTRTTWTQDKWPAQRHEDLRNALLAWQTNPLARRIVNLTRDHVQQHPPRLAHQDRAEVAGQVLGSPAEPDGRAPARVDRRTHHRRRSVPHLPHQSCRRHDLHPRTGFRAGGRAGLAAQRLRATDGHRSARARTVGVAPVEDHSRCTALRTRRVAICRQQTAGRNARRRRPDAHTALAGRL